MRDAGHVELIVKATQTKRCVDQARITLALDQFKRLDDWDWSTQLLAAGRALKEPRGKTANEHPRSCSSNCYARHARSPAGTGCFAPFLHQNQTNADFAAAVGPAECEPCREEKAATSATATVNRLDLIGGLIPTAFAPKVTTPKRVRRIPRAGPLRDRHRK